MSRLYYLLIIVFILVNSVGLAQPWAKFIDEKEDNFFNVQSAFNKYWDGKEQVRGEGWKQFKRWEYMWEQRTYPSGKIPNANEVLRSYLDFENNTKSNEYLLSVTSDWKEVGPVNIPQNKLNYQSGGLGRINVVRIHPNDKNTIWIGSAGGGAWFTTNKGQSWTKAKFTDVLSLGVSDIAFAPSKPEIMYLSTGDKNGFFMTNEYSVGLMKSIDGGKNWSLTSEVYKPNDFHLSNRIIVHPNNPNLVYIATSRGILRSKDGASTWENINNSAYFRDIEFNPENPQIIYATTSGSNQGTTNGRIFRSTNGGDSWTLILSLKGSSRIDLGVTSANPDIVYAVAARSSGGFHSLVLSTNAGATFTTQSNTPNILSIDVNGGGTQGQGFYDLAIAVSPNNPDILFVGGIHTWVSSNAGKTWKILNHWTGSYSLPYIHADQHHFVFSRDGQELFTAHDGGLSYTTDRGVSWKDISDGLAIAQFYRIDVSPSAPNMIVGGTQDNGSHLFKDNSWSQVNGGDGMACAIDPVNSNYVYTSTQYGNLFRSTNGGTSYSRIAGPDLFQGETANWVTPLILNPENPSSVFIGFRNVFKTTNRGNSWVKLTNFTNSAAINHIAMSPSDTNIMYMVVRNYLYKSTNGGVAWTGIFNRPSWITGIAVDPANPDRVFVTLSGYTQSDRVYEINGSQSINITYNLPNIPANTIVVQRNTSGRLFIGTDIGAFVKSDDFSKEWKLFNVNLPPAVISDLKINYSTGKLYAGTYGRGIWETKLYDCTLPKPEIKITGELSFCEGDSVVLDVLTFYNDILWSTGETSKRIVAKKDGNYFVSIRNEIGCTEVSEPVNVSILSVPAFSIRSNRGMVLCGENDTISLSVSIGLSDYLWSTGATTNRISVYEPGYYSIRAFTHGGCPLFDSVYIPMRSIPDKPNIYYNDGVLSTDSAASYSWFRNGKSIPGATGKEYTPTESGEFFVVATNENGCSNSSEVINVITSVATISYNPVGKFSISPNPFNGFVRISPLSDSESLEIEIIDYLGRKLASDFVHSLSVGQDYMLNLDYLPVGSYILLIKTKNEIYSYNIKRLE